MKSTTATPFRFLTLASLPFALGACGLVFSACATPPASTAATPASAPTPAPMAAAPATPAPVVAMPVMAAIDFDAKVQPFFASYCFRCHGPSRQAGRTRFDTKAGILARVTPGDAANSTLFGRISSTDDEHMPPMNIQDQPTPEEIAMIKQWINEGAKISDSYPSGT